MSAAGYSIPVADDSRYRDLRRFAKRNETSPSHDAGVSIGGFDADLLAYATWARGVRGLSESTIRVRCDFLRRLHLFLGHPLRWADAEELLRFERLAIAGRAAESRRAYVCHLRAFYRWMTQAGTLAEDPSLKLTLPRVPRHLPRPIDEDDLALAIEAARPKMRAMLTLAAYAGLRACEIAGMDWSDLRTEADGSAFLHVRKGKGNKQRMVEVGSTVLEALKLYGLKSRGPMFLGLDNRQMAPASVSRSINRFLREHRIPATAHQLRHRYGSIAYQLSRDLRLVQEQMGHESPQTTAGYTRPSQDAAARMVRLMDQLPLQRMAGDVSARR